MATAIRRDGSLAAKSFFPNSANERPSNQNCSGGYWKSVLPAQVTVKNAPRCHISTPFWA